MKPFVNKWKNDSSLEKPTDKTDKSPTQEGGKPPFVGFVSSEIERRFVFSSTGSSSDTELLARAKMLIALYGPLQIVSGMNGCAVGVVNPETLVSLYHRWPWGIIQTASGISIMKWGEVP